MVDFFNQLSTIERFFYIVAIPATVVLVIQTIMTIFGLADGDDLDIVADVGEAADFQFFSVRGLVSFFTIFGWVGVVLSEKNAPLWLTVLISAISGLAAMFLVGYLFYTMTKLQSNGSVNYQNAIGLTGEVYIPIPANGKGTGKIQLLLQERYVEVEAMTNDNRLLKRGSLVKVTGLVNNHTLMVESFNK